MLRERHARAKCLMTLENYQKYWESYLDQMLPLPPRPTTPRSAGAGTATASVAGDIVA